MAMLTIGLPVYNAMPFLPESMESLLGQDYPHFNILVIDDGSTDESSAYLSSITDPRVRVLRQENRGLTFTLNRMLQELDTPWLVRHDADDIAYPGRIRLIQEHIERFPDAGMFYSLATYRQGGRNVASFRTTAASPATLRDLTKAGYLLAICHPTVALNVERTLGIGAYRFDLHIEDIDLWWRMALENDIVLIPQPTVAVRHNLSSVSHGNLREQTINTLFVQYLLLSHLWELPARPYDEVLPMLGKMVDGKELAFRESIRRANIYIGKRDLVRGVFYMGKGFFASPVSFLHRVVYELRNNGTVVNGVNPRLFSALRSQLW